jgi:hypothetical protein
MASYTVAKGEIGAHAKTLVANIVDEVVFVDNKALIEVVSDGAAEIYFTVDASAPTVGGAAAYYLPAVPCSRTVPSPKPGETAVRLISAGTPKYSVAGGE